MRGCIGVIAIAMVICGFAIHWAFLVFSGLLFFLNFALAPPIQLSEESKIKLRASIIIIDIVITRIAISSSLNRSKEAERMIGDLKAVAREIIDKKNHNSGFIDWCYNDLKNRSVNIDQFIPSIANKKAAEISEDDFEKIIERILN